MLRYSADTFLVLVAVSLLVGALGGFTAIPRWVRQHRLAREELRQQRARAMEAEERAINEQLNSPPSASVPFVITSATAKRLRAHGFTDAEIAKMTPDVAWRIVQTLG